METTDDVVVPRSLTDGDKQTTIPLMISTRNEFREYGKKGEKWDHLVRRSCTALTLIEKIKTMNNVDEIKKLINECMGD